MVAVGFMLTGMMFGAVGSIGVFLKPLSAEFGWSRGEIAFGYTSVGLAMASGIVWGHLADRYGTRPLAVLGVMGMVSALFLLSRQAALWQLYGACFMMGALGHSMLNGPLYANIGFWFTRNKGLALGATSAGGAMGQAVVPFVAQLMITANGWRAAYAGLAVAYLVIALPLALLVRDPEARVRSAGGAAPRTGENGFPLSHGETTAWLGAAVIFCCTCMAVPIVHLVPLITDRGIHPQTGAGVLAVLMLTGVIGRILSGKLADHIGSLGAYMIASFGQTVLVLWFPFVTPITGLYLLAAAFGFIYSGVMTAILVCVREMIPPRVSGRAMGIVVFFAWIGMGFGGYQGGLFFDLTGDYVWSYANAAIAGMINLAILASFYFRIRNRRAAFAAA